MKIKKNDIIIFILILFIALLFFLYEFIFKSDEGAYVIVMQYDEQIGRYSLDRDGKYPIGDKDNAYNLLVIKDGSAYMEEADCPDKLCVKQKKIHLKGETIVCLPHELVIQVETGERAEIDAVTN